MTLPEELGTKALQAQAFNLERSRERKLNQQKRNEAETREAQAVLVLLQAKIDALKEQASTIAGQI